MDAAPAALDLSRLASGDAELIVGLEQDLSGAFPESATTVGQLGSTKNAGVGLPHAQASVRTAVQQMAQSGAVTGDASTISKLLLDQNETLQERVASLEKSRPASVISAHTALEGAEDTANAADSSRPGGLVLAQQF